MCAHACVCFMHMYVWLVMRAYDIVLGWLIGWAYLWLSGMVVESIRSLCCWCMCVCVCAIECCYWCVGLVDLMMYCSVDNANGLCLC